MAGVLIGIQARSGSKRLPRKAFELIGGRTMLDRVIDACKQAAWKIDEKGNRCHVAVLTPTADPIVDEFSSRVTVVQGPEHDVLARYGVAAEKYKPDLVVRVTGDCPFVQTYLIAYLTHLTVKHGYDYLSNVDERVRTALDGSDCEVFSTRLLEYALEHATKPTDREHVTTFMRRSPPPWARMATAQPHFDLSHIKLSVDTPEDLERARAVFDSTFTKQQEAFALYGKSNVHRL